ASDEMEELRGNFKYQNRHYNGLSTKRLKLHAYKVQLVQRKSMKTVLRTTLDNIFPGRWI
ncbi:hypothetical protein L9F63_005281, partial [Diploptera punctata]